MFLLFYKLARAVPNSCLMFLYSSVAHHKSYHSSLISRSALNSAENGASISVKVCVIVVLLSAGNYIAEEKVEPLKQRLDFVNSLSISGLDEYYKEILFNFETEDPLKTGLGLIDMRRRSKNILKFNFIDLHNGFSFFTIQVTLKKTI